MNGHSDSRQNTYAQLAGLSTEALYALLRADIGSTTADDDETIACILEILEQREHESPTGRLSDVDQAWKAFQTHYHTSEGDGLELYPCHDGSEKSVDVVAPKSAAPVRKPIRLTRMFRNLVAAAVILLASLVTAQAAGLDIFGAIGRWTEENFNFAAPDQTTEKNEDPHLASTPFEVSNPYYKTMVDAVSEVGISEKLVPAWLPEGFITDGITTYNDSLGDEIYGIFRNEAGLYFDIGISRYNDASNITDAMFEKDDTVVEMYISKGRAFYIMSNINSIGAVWSDGESLLVYISGSISKNEIIEIIDSMGG